MQETNKVKITMQIDATTRKEWKQFCLDNNMTLTTALKVAMKDFMEKKILQTEK